MLNEFEKKISAIEALERAYEIVDNQLQSYKDYLENEKEDLQRCQDAGEDENSWTIKNSKTTIESIKIKIDTLEEVIIKIMKMM